jgi:hypothetical protein
MGRSLAHAQPWLGRALAACALALAGCGGGGAEPDGGVGTADAGGDAAAGCPPVATDGTRKVVVSRPYAEGGGQADVYEVLTLGDDGALAQPGVTFEMGRATSGRIAMAPDGRVAMVAQNDGSVGVFRFDAQGQPRVLHARYDAGGQQGFYASSVVIAPDGGHAWVLSAQWREHGGGVYRLAIDCDGTVSYEGRVAEAKLPYGLALGPTPDRALLAAADVLDSVAGDDAYLLDWSDPPAVIAGADPFPDDEAIVSAAVLTAGGRHLLVADYSQFYTDEELENRLAVIEVGAAALAPVQTVTGIEDPYDVVASPDDDAVLVVSGFGDALFALPYDPENAAAPLAAAAELTYSGGRPQLPGHAALVERGPQRGLVLVAENQGVRRVRFEGDGQITDLGLTPIGEGLTAIVGAIGVTP